VGRDARRYPRTIKPVHVPQRLSALPAIGRLGPLSVITNFQTLGNPPRLPYAIDTQWIGAESRDAGAAGEKI